MKTIKKVAAPKGPPPTGGEQLQEARKSVEEYVARVLAMRRKLDDELLKVNASAMTPRFEKQNRDDIARWARKQSAEKVLRTAKVSDTEYQVETSGEGLGRLRYTLKVLDGAMRIDTVQRLCDFCNGKGTCPHCDGKLCKDCSRTGLCFVCEGRVWEDYSRNP